MCRNDGGGSMQIRAIGGRPCFAIILFFTCAAAAGQENAVSDELRSLREQIAKLQQEAKDTHERYTAQIKELGEKVERLQQKTQAAAQPEDREEKAVEPKGPLPEATPTGGYGSPLGD